MQQELTISAPMPTHIALLRGINVGGHKQVAMADLRQLLEHKFPPREPILGSWLVRQTLAMLYERRKKKAV